MDIRRQGWILSGLIPTDPSILFWPMLVRLNRGLGKVGPAAESPDTSARTSGWSGRC